MNPFVEEDLEDATYESDDIYIPKEYGIDFDTGQLTGKIVEGVEAVKVWVWLALQTARERYCIYSTDYGQEYEDLIGKGYSKGYTDMELRRMTEECLLINPYITAIENFSAEKNDSRVTLSFKVITLLGDTGVRADV